MRYLPLWYIKYLFNNFNGFRRKMFDHRIYYHVRTRGELWLWSCHNRLYLWLGERLHQREVTYESESRYCGTGTDITRRQQLESKTIPSLTDIELLSAILWKAFRTRFPAILSGSRNLDINSTFKGSDGSPYVTNISVKFPEFQSLFFRRRFLWISLFTIKKLS